MEAHRMEFEKRFMTLLARTPFKLAALDGNSDTNRFVAAFFCESL
jgi:hypothetical protein